MSYVEHWGEFSDDGAGDSIPDITKDIEHVMNNFNLSEFQLNDDIAPKMEVVQLTTTDPYVSYAITLHKYAKNLVDKMKSGGNRSNQQEDKYVIIPSMPKILRQHKKNSLNYVPKEFTDFTTGKDVELPQINRVIVREILTKCVAILFAHIASDQSALDVLIDVLEHFFVKVTQNLKVAVHDEERGDLAGFPNVIERVFTELGMGGVKGIMDYYHSRVIKYVNVLQERCKLLNEEYQNILIPYCPSPVEKINKMVKVKVEEEDVTEVENAEVHFSTIDGDVNFSILETGYQLLNNLEAEEHLQNLSEADEDLNVTGSPGVPVHSDNDVSHLSPFNKKKRFK